MSKPNAVLAEPLTLGQETSHPGTRCSGKALVLSSLLIGLVIALSLLTRREVEEPAVDMFGAQLANPSAMRGTLSCPAVQQKIKEYGIPSGRLAEYALTQYVATATRDVSMAAQAREEFSNLDPVTQAKLKQLRKDVVVKAASLKPEDMAGVTAPMGFFDPWGLSKKGNLEVYRKAELKHGRVCMLAVLGILVTEKGFHPFYDAWGDGPFSSAVASHFSSTAADNFWPAFWINTAAHEFAFETTGTANKPAEDFMWDPLGLAPKDPAAFKEVQNKELNNGRLAMLAAAGIMAQELVTGKKIF